MTTGGLSKARLDRMHEVMAGYVERREVPGLVTLISRRGEVHVDAIGMKALGGSDPMRRDVLGVLIARASGQPLETFFRERLFEPLGMKDTGFSVPAPKLDRLATSYWTNPLTGAFELYDAAEGGQWSRPPAFPSGSAGLVSTIDDYLAFGQMMLSKGKHGSERILSRPSVETMTTDQLTAEQKTVSGLVPGYFDSHGWGFGLSVVTRRDDLASVPGRSGWDGGLGTSWYSDPREEMVGILMTQRAWTSPNPPNVCLDFWTSAYQAIDD